MFGHKTKNLSFVREPRTDLEDLRDDCIALYLNSGLTMAQIAANGGPTVGTISRWLYKETRFPHLDTIRAFIRAVGHDLAIVPRERLSDFRHKQKGQRMPRRAKPKK